PRVMMERRIGSAVGEELALRAFGQAGAEMVHEHRRAVLVPSARNAVGLAVAQLGGPSHPAAGITFHNRRPLGGIAPERGRPECRDAHQRYEVQASRPWVSAPGEPSEPLPLMDGAS